MLIGIMTCHAKPESLIPMPDRVLVDHTQRVQPIRETWAQDCDYKFFFGEPVKSGLADEVYLPCGDSYFETSFKVREMCRWALNNNHTSLFKVDDDTYVRPERLLTAGYEQHDFVGRLLPPEYNHPVPYPMGGTGYYLGERMLELAANDMTCVSDPHGDEIGRCNTYEDGWIGRVAKDAGIELVDDLRLRCHHCHWCPVDEWIPGSPRKDNDIITGCEFVGQDMWLAHNNWLNS